MAKLATKFFETLNDALDDRSYGKELQELATRAGLAGVGSAEWIELTQHFSDDPTELAQMRDPKRTGAINTNITQLCMTAHGPDTSWTGTTFTTGLVKGQAQTSSKRRPAKTRAGKKSSKK